MMSDAVCGFSFGLVPTTSFPQDRKSRDEPLFVT